MDLKEVISLDEFKDYERSLDISHSKFHIKNVISKETHDIIVNTKNLLLTYYPFIQDKMKTVKLSDEEYAKYKYQPKKFSYDLYGTTELWSLLLRVNNMPSAVFFNTKNVRVFSTEILSVINEILIMEEDAINRNNSLLEKYD